MSWLRIDDGFTEHRKIVGLKRAERWTWLEVLTYCARQGNGTIPRGISDVMKHVTRPFLARCVDLGLVDDHDGVLEVHDWELYNPKDPLKAGRQARWRDKKASTEASTPPSTGPSTESGDVDEESVYTSVAPVPSPTPAPYKGSTVTDYPYLPVVPETVGGENEIGEAEPDRAIVVPDLREFPEPDPWDDV